jgi:DNA-binding LytR/AlgR family response regulator
MYVCREHTPQAQTGGEGRTGMNICICDDDGRFCFELEMALTRYSFSVNCDFHVTAYQTPEELLHSDKKFDLIFIDIRFYGQDVGIRLARQLRDAKNHAYIIFFTSLPGYIQDGYKAEAFRYLMKPIDVDALHEALDAIIKKMSGGDLNYRITVKVGAQLRVINVETLKWIESGSGVRRRKLFTESEVVEVWEALSSLQSRLPPGLFAYSHQSFLVNLAYVQAIKNELVWLRGGETLPIGRSYKKEFLLALERYAGGLLWPRQY